MSTDLIQLLNFLRPIMGENSRRSTPTSGRELSDHITRDLAPKKTNQAETYSAQRRQSPFRYKLALPRDLREPS